MTETKKRRSIEIYEDYWSLTVGHTNYFTKDTPSFKVLKLLNDFVDNNDKPLKKGDPRYHELQKKVLLVSSVIKKIFEFLARGGSLSLFALVLMVCHIK